VAATFIPKCTTLAASERVEMWVKCGMIVKAAEEAAKVKDTAKLEELRASATGNAALEVDRIIKSLEKGRR